MTDKNLAFGIDISRYNTSADGRLKMDFAQVASHDPAVSFIGMRAGISWGYQDPWFSFYFQEAMRINRVCLPYHVLYPGEPAISQMDNFFRIVGTIDFERVPLVLDLELSHGQSVSRITETTAKAIQTLTRRTGRKPILYSRSSWVNQYLRVSALPPVHWWLAQYLWARPYPLYTPEYPSPPDPLPHGVSTWLIHQTTARGKSIGTLARHYMDYNRFNGSQAGLREFIGQPDNMPATCPFDDLPCERARR